VKTPIIDLCASTPKLKLKLGTRGCNGQQVIASDIEMHIRQVSCPEQIFPAGLPLVDMCNGCPPQMLPGQPARSMYTPPNALPQHVAAPPAVYLIYPSLGTDDDGLTEFYFDAKLFTSPPGRYHASVVIDACSCMEFDINLCCDPIEIEQIVLESANSCEESC